MLYNIRLQFFFFFSLLFTLVLVINVSDVLGLTNISTDLPTREDIQIQLNSLNKQKELSAQEKLAQKDLIKILETLNKIDRIEDETKKFQQKVAQSPEKIRQVSEKLNAINSSDNDIEIYKTMVDLSLHQLEFLISQLLDELQISQNDLASCNRKLVSLQMQPERVKSAIYAASQELQQIHNLLNDVNSRDNILRPSQKILLLTQQFLLNVQINQQRKNLEGNAILQDVLQKQRDYIISNINRIEHQLQVLQEAVKNKRLTLTKKTIQDSTFTDGSLHIQSNPLIKQELDINHQIRKRLIQATESGNTLAQKNTQVKIWLDRALQSEHNIKEQISMLKGSLLLSRVLYQQQKTLPSSEELEDMTNRIADLRLEQFSINQNRDALFQNDTFINKLKERYPYEISNEIRDALLQIIDMRRELLDQLNKQLSNQLLVAINLQINQQQLITVSKNLQGILAQQIFWVNSNKPIDWEWIKTFPSALKNQIKGIKITINQGKSLATVTISVLTGLPLLLISGLIYWKLDWLKQYQMRLALEVNQLHNNSQLHILKAIFIDLIRTIPICLLILAIGMLFLTTHLNISTLLWVFSKKLALFWLVFGLFWKILEKDGVAVHHFNISEKLTRCWRQKIARTVLILLPLHFWSAMSELSPLYLMDDVLGQFVIVLNLLLITTLLLPVCYNSLRDKESHSLRIATVSILSIVPIALMILMATGYFYTTLRLASRWIETVYLVVLWNLLYKTMLCSLRITTLCNTYRCTMEKHKDAPRKKITTQEKLDVASKQVNQQTIRITMLIMISVFTVIFWAIWSDLITVFSYLDSIVLWNYSDIEAGNSVVKNVTMSSLLFAIIASVVTWALIRNLPELLEVVVLSRMRLQQGASYAITTIMKYVISIVGTMTVFGSLGVAWDKLQWLVAALSVGLGFGLQEIFGNFVSGLIILFERPVRIGDTITIGTFSGMVSKIRIRATTITDFDRKEVIIPNKAFVTERLINWSLSDTITRVVIRIGVAYGSDLDKVKEVLLKVAMEHPKVMNDPAPAVFFTSFGSSALDHELRLYVRELRDRSYTIDELNRAINHLCYKNNINIAFNQLEVHLHNEKKKKNTEEKHIIKIDDFYLTS